MTNQQKIKPIDIVLLLFFTSVIIFIFWMSFSRSTTIGTQPPITRGPYLQRASTSEITVRWRTSSARNSIVRYGTNSSNLDQTVSSAALTTEHIVTITELNAGTRYYYALEDSIGQLTTGEDYFFETHPDSNSTEPFRIWAIGDSGTGNSDAEDVRDAYIAVNGETHSDVWLMLGDNAYGSGTDAQYQWAVFDTYPTILRNSVLWPLIGNHDYDSFDKLAPETWPYYDMFTLPENGEAGGEPSGTESYYSFDYGQVHFVILDSIGTDRSLTGAMATWLENDLSNNDKEWLVAAWHHPPYTKGSHDSDKEDLLIDMRENFLPILESHGVDLVLGGHSHSYERSMLIDGHYGHSNTFNSTMIEDGGDGDPNGDGHYEKDHAPHEGAVYIVAGSSGKKSSASLDHPIMQESMAVLGSVIIDVDDKLMDVRFIDDYGAIRDLFRIEHLEEIPTPTNTPTP